MADEQLIKPRELPAASTVFADDAIMTDNGSVVGKATPVQIVNAGAPVPTEAEAIAGTDNSKRMTPLTVKQVLDSVTAPSVLRAQAWAESDSPPNPGIPGSMSAKSWAAEAERLGSEQADRAEAAAADAVNSAPFPKNNASEFFGSTSLVSMATYWAKDGAGVWATVPTGGDLIVAGKSVSVVKTMFPSPEAFGFVYGGDKSLALPNGEAVTKCLEKFGVAFLRAGTAWAQDIKFPAAGGALFGVEGRTVLKQDPDIIDERLYVLSANRYGVNTSGRGGTYLVDGVTFHRESREDIPTHDDTRQHKHLVAMFRVDEAIFRKCGFIGPQGDALYFGQKAGEDPTINDFNGRIVVEDCLFDGVDRKNRNAVSVIDCRSAVVRKNKFTRMSSNTQPGAVDFEPNNYAVSEIQNIYVGENEFHDCGGGVSLIGVYVPNSGSKPVHNIVIEKNFSSGKSYQANGATAVMVVLPYSVLSVDNGIRVRDNNFSGYDSVNGVRGFRLDGVRGAQFSGNIWEDFDRNLGGQISFDHPCMDISIADTFRRCGGGPNPRGMEIRTVHGLDMRGSIFDDCGGSADANSSAINFKSGTSSRVNLSGVVVRTTAGVTKRAVLTDAGHTYTPSSNSLYSPDFSGLPDDFQAEMTDYKWINYVPAVFGLTTNGVGTYSSQWGRWRRDGRFVEFTANVVFSAHTGTGPAVVTLPRNVNPTSAQEQIAQMMIEGAAVTGQQYARIQPVTKVGGVGVAMLYRVDAGVANGISVPASGATVRVSGRYLVE